MTVQTAFHSWQESPRQPDPKTCAPLLMTIGGYLIDRWGGQDLGCYASRPIIGGSVPSSHSSGAARDWRYADPGPGRDVLLAEVLPFLIDNSLELGVQAIHDYAGCRIWRPPGTSGRPTEPSPECGWKAQNPGSQMGQSWALWIHVECLDSRWSDVRSIDEMLIPEEDDMPLSDEDIAKVADAVWRYMIDTTTGDGSDDKEAARFLVDRTYNTVGRIEKKLDDRSS